MGKDITLIQIPCWWDKTQQSLVATIKAARPDLLRHMQVDTQPIPRLTPSRVLNHFNKLQPRVEDIGEPMTACFMTLTDVNPKGWWMFEKYDGIRAFWNPNKRSFFSRFGRAFDIPQEIIDSMPTNIFFDGLEETSLKNR